MGLILYCSLHPQYFRSKHPTASQSMQIVYSINALEDISISEVKTRRVVFVIDPLRQIEWNSLKAVSLKNDSNIIFIFISSFSVYHYLSYIVSLIVKKIWLSKHENSVYFLLFFCYLNIETLLLLGLLTYLKLKLYKLESTAFCNAIYINESCARQC